MNTERNLLIIEDELDLSSVIKDLLSPFFTNITCASNGEEAIAVLNATNPTLIICDLNMPKLNGIEFIQKLRALGNQVPVLILTGYGSKQHALSALRLGAADFIDKPFDSNDLIQSVERVLEIEKRRKNLMFQNPDETEEVARQKKMLGLLQVSGERRKNK